MDNAKNIYLIWDRKLGTVEGATTNLDKAEEMVDKLNRLLGKGISRYTITTEKDFAK